MFEVHLITFIDIPEIALENRSKITAFENKSKITAFINIDKTTALINTYKYKKV